MEVGSVFWIAVAVFVLFCSEGGRNFLVGILNLGVFIGFLTVAIWFVKTVWYAV